MARYFTGLKTDGSFVLASPVTPARIVMWVYTPLETNDKTGLPAGIPDLTGSVFDVHDFTYSGGAISSIGAGFTGVIANVRFYDGSNNLINSWLLNGNAAATTEADTVGGNTITRTNITASRVIEYEDPALEMDATTIDYWDEAGSTTITLDGTEADNYFEYASHADVVYGVTGVHVTADYTSDVNLAQAWRWVVGINSEWFQGNGSTDYIGISRNGKLYFQITETGFTGTISNITAKPHITATQALVDDAPTTSTPPTVTVGADANVLEGEGATTSLTGTATPAGGKTITSTVWTETTANGLTITNPTTLIATVDLSGLAVDAVATFRLTATDSDSETAFDEITYTITSSVTTVDATIHIFGDSIANWIGSTNRTTDHPAHYAALGTTATIINNGVGGDNTRKMLARLPAILSGISDGANHLFIFVCGTNAEEDDDLVALSGDASDTQFRINARKMIKLIHQAGHRAAIATKTASSNDETASVEPATSLRNSLMCQELLPEWFDTGNSRAYIDHYTFTDGGHAADPTWFGDNVHPNAYGSDLIQEYTAGVVSPKLDAVFGNTLPTVSIGSDRQVTVDESYTITATASDFDPDTLSYKWYADYELLTGETSSTLTRTETEDSSIVITCAVLDGKSSNFAEATITSVSDPTITAMTSLTDIAANTAVEVTATITPGTGTISSYAWTQTSGAETVTLTGSTTATVGFTTPAAAQTTVLTLLVTDSNGETDTETWSVTNLAVVLTGQEITPANYTIKFKGL